MLNLKTLLAAMIVVLMGFGPVALADDAPADDSQTTTAPDYDDEEAWEVDDGECIMDADGYC